MDKQKIKTHKIDYHILLSKKYLDYFFICISILLGCYLNWSYPQIGFFVLMVWLVLRPVKSHILAKISFVALILVPILLILRRHEKAEDFAVTAFIFLFFSVVMTIYENMEQSKKRIK